MYENFRILVAFDPGAENNQIQRSEVIKELTSPSQDEHIHFGVFSVELKLN